MERACSFSGSFGSNGAWFRQGSKAGAVLKQSFRSGDLSLHCCPQTVIKKGKGEREKAKPLEVPGLWIRPTGAGNQTSSLFWIAWTLRGVGRGCTEWCFDLNSDQIVSFACEKPRLPRSVLLSLNDWQIVIWAQVLPQPPPPSSYLENGSKMTCRCCPSFPQCVWPWVATSAKDLGWKQIQTPG